ncbi:MAG: transposase [Candidatus Rokuibacteriota bacterium]
MRRAPPQPGRPSRPSSANGRRCPGVVRSPQEGGEELLTFFRFPKSQWKTLHTTNVIERLHEEFRRRVKTQGSLPTKRPRSCCSSASWPAVRFACGASTAGARSPPCSVKVGGRQHDASRRGSRIASERPTYISISPELVIRFPPPTPTARG